MAAMLQKPQYNQANWEKNMRFQNKRIFRSTIVAALVLLISGPVQAGFIDLKVTGIGVNAMLEIETNSKQCNGNINCSGTTKGSAEELDFKLKHACQDGGPVYKLTGMQFSMIENQTDPAGNTTKPFGAYILPPIVISDFNLNADGTPIWGNSANDNKIKDDKIWIKDKNAGKYVIFYKIEATKCVEPYNKIYLDPRVENTGK